MTCNLILSKVLNRYAKLLSTTSDYSLISLKRLISFRPATLLKIDSNTGVFL